MLTPMSDIAGRLAIQIGAHLLHQPQGGKGLLLGGLPAAERGKVCVIGAGQAGGNAVAMAAAMGGHVRVGLEDNLWIAKGRLAQSNAEQVRLIRGIVEALGREVATPDEARAMLGLKGADQVGF